MVDWVMLPVEKMIATTWMTTWKPLQRLKGKPLKVAQRLCLWSLPPKRPRSSSKQSPNKTNLGQIGHNFQGQDRAPPQPPPPPPTTNFPRQSKPPRRWSNKRKVLASCLMDFAVGSVALFLASGSEARRPSKVGIGARRSSRDSGR